MHVPECDPQPASWGPPETCPNTIYTVVQKTGPIFSSNFNNYWSVSIIFGIQNLQRVHNVHTCSLRALTKPSRPTNCCIQCLTASLANLSYRKFFTFKEHLQPENLCPAALRNTGTDGDLYTYRHMQSQSGVTYTTTTTVLRPPGLCPALPG